MKLIKYNGGISKKSEFSDFLVKITNTVIVIARPVCRQAGSTGQSSSMLYYVYILASKRNGTLYIGVTRDLVKRVYEHKSDLVEGFTKRYQVHNLVYYEETKDVHAALEREKRLKKWNRKWKLRLIEEFNPTWEDLYDKII